VDFSKNLKKSKWWLCPPKDYLEVQVLLGTPLLKFN